VANVKPVRRIAEKAYQVTESLWDEQDFSPEAFARARAQLEALKEKANDGELQVIAGCFEAITKIEQTRTTAPRTPN
jgi:hypothetical protein